MRLALAEAERAYEEGEVPVGAVVVKGDRVIGRGYNLTERMADPTAHAEIIAITAAAAALESWRLEGCRMYVTLEPCPMCAGAIVNARLDALLFGAYDARAGAAGTLFTITTDTRLNHQVETLGGVLDDDCAGLLKAFFRTRRGKPSPGEGA
ncbi:MAG: tRNA-specific adenosine deaminase [Chlorobi bacterium]|nr:tRNA-specific adenosine deaminase [Chlorobiota bacterium]